MYRNPSFLAKNLYKANQAKNKQTINQVNDGLIDLRNALSKKTNPENENPDKVVDIVENSLTLVDNKKVKDSKY